MKRWVGMVLSVIMATGLLSACGNGDIEDQITDVVQSEDTHILGVKGGTPTDYPGKTYGEAFENFFGSPTWKYFVGTKEGADEDGDGKPDYTEENVDIVEFTGRCTYQDVEVKALIQFTLSKDGDTFEATYLSFNEVPQNMLMLSALLEAAFTNEDIDAVEETDSNEWAQKNDVDTQIHRYELLRNDVTWEQAYDDCKSRGGYLVQINSLEEYQHIIQQINGEAKQDVHFFLGGRRSGSGRDYYWINSQNEFEGDSLNPGKDSWAAGHWMENEPSYSSDGEAEQYMSLVYYQNAWVFNDVPEDISKYYSGKIGYICEYDEVETEKADGGGNMVIPDYVGTWWDTNSQRCNMEISSYDKTSYNIEINWGSSACDNTHWSFYGTYDEMAGGIHYYGSRIEEYYPDNGEVQETCIYSDGEGLIWIGDDGMLYWDDYIENQGADCSFEKSDY